MKFSKIILIIAIILWGVLLGGVVYSHIVYFPVFLSNLPDSAVLVKPKGKNKKMGKGAKPINANVDWKPYTSYFEKTGREKLINNLAGILLQTKTAVGADIIKEYANESDRESFIRSATIQIMSTPEYQLC